MGPTINSTARAVFTDLDGTLLNAHQQLALVNRETLERLGKDKIWRIVVTGRSLFSARRVLDPYFPIDVLVTSSGAGIFSFPGEQMLHSTMMEEPHVQRSAAILKQLALDFMIHAPLPDNHFFKWHRSGGQNTDFCKRLEIYSGCPQPLPEMLIQADPAQYLKSVMGARSAGMAPFAPEALAELGPARDGRGQRHAARGGGADRAAWGTRRERVRFTRRRLSERVRFRRALLGGCHESERG